MRFPLRRSAEMVLLGVFLSGFLITLGLMGDFWRSFSDGLAREPVPEGPFMTQKAVPLKMGPSSSESSPSSPSMAVWISNPDSDWQSLLSGLRRQGLPFRIAHDLKDLDTEVIMVYPTFSGKVIPDQIYQYLLHKVRLGSVLITQNVESELGRHFGFKKARFSLDESHICMGRPSSECKDKGQGWSSLRFEKPNGESSGFETMAYEGARHPLASFGNGGAALIVNPFGKGALYAFGLDLGAIIRQAQGIGLPIKPIVETGSVDLTRWTYDQIQAIYLDSGARHPLIQKSNRSKPEAVITHAIRKESDLLEAVRWAAEESRLGVKALYIVDHAFLKGMTPDLWISPLPKAQLSSIAHLGHVIALGWLNGSPPLDALEIGTGEESIHWTDDQGRRNKPTFPNSQTGILRIGRQVLEQGYGLGTVDVFVTDQELIPVSFEKALRDAGFRYLSRSGFAEKGLNLPMLLNAPGDEGTGQDLTLLPSRIRVEGVSEARRPEFSPSLLLLDIPLASETRERIEAIYNALDTSFQGTELGIYLKQAQTYLQTTTVLERHRDKYQFKIASPDALGSLTIHLPAGLRKAYRLPKKCPERLAVEVQKGEQRVTLCQISRRSVAARIRGRRPRMSF